MRRTIVAFELDDARLWKVVLEIENVAQVGAAPFVNRLIGVTYNTQIAMLPRKALNQQILRPVRVLLFVDHDMDEFSSVFVPDRFGLLEEFDRLEQQIVEVERIGVS